jgi:hypothetical protein
MTVRITMWSGPRNISTALMRAFENRDDTAVSDEPFYAAYLAASGLEHPMRATVLGSQPNDWHEVVAGLTGPAPQGRPIWYQKHMCHHMLDGFGLDWTDRCQNAFLIRAPDEVLASYSRKRSTVTFAEIGIVRQAEMFDRVAQRTGIAPPVIDAADVLAAPRTVLTALCERLGIPFSDRMLHWPAGRRASDGVWAPAWYDVVEQSTGFAPPSRPASTRELPADLAALARAAQPFFESMARWRLAAIPHAEVEA